MGIKCYAATKAKEILQPFEYEPAVLGPWDIELAITHCGICHSDLSLIDNEWGTSIYPMIPGHEIVGKITEMGSNVTNFKLNQRVGIGWQRSSCMHCDWCIAGEENLCSKQTATCVGSPGGYADRIRADSRFAFAIPDQLDSAHVAPLFCAGATVFSPLVRYNINALSRVGIIGIGGLGHLALQFAKGFGCEVTAFSTSIDKKEESERLGADHFVLNNDTASLGELKNSFDLILSTVAVPLDWQMFVHLLRPKGVLCLVGAQTNTLEVPFFSLISGRKSLSASNIGSRPDIRKLLHFAALHGIKADVEVFKMEDVNIALDKVRSGKIRYRAVLENS